MPDYHHTKMSKLHRMQETDLPLEDSSRSSTPLSQCERTCRQSAALRCPPLSPRGEGRSMRSSLPNLKDMNAVSVVAHPWDCGTRVGRCVQSRSLGNVGRLVPARDLSVEFTI